ncbi:hypothetical protein FEM48_Zijuj02G0083200 [Ziziphus jujuba var. spinosa]|uniref:Licodione synthase-like n=1 Tax=Ziziphus jujuba var. spinosa TaxID=714518 RepID=A0A978VUM9_ZIZJJ|nr:hypothetical protein FEM48_Zijuj02G0083200 [Ziziphus jujuba var. spinosa]
MVVELLTLFLLVALLLRFILLQPNNDDLPPTPFALPIIGHFHLLGPLIHRSLHNLSLRYGPLFSFRLGSVPCIVVSTPDLAKQFLKTNELSFISHAYSIAISRLTYDSSLAFAPYGPYWKFIKKLTMNELLGSRPINNFLSLRARENRRLLIYLAKKSELGEAVNLTEELPKLSNSIIAHMILGTRCSSMEGRVEEARTVIRDVTKIFGEFNLSDYIWFCRRLDLQGFGKRIEDIHKRFDTLLEKIIAEREEFRKKKKEDADQETCNDQEEEEVKDFLDILLDITEDDNAEITLTRLHIKALVMEMCRSMDAKYWENPLEFCPERFLENRDGEKTSQKIDVKGQHFQVLPFGSGRRICPGMNLALQMLPGLLAGMVQCFDWKVVGGKTNDDDDDHHQVLKMDERPGMTAPRAHDLVCVPVEEEMQELDFEGNLQEEMGTSQPWGITIFIPYFDKENHIYEDPMWLTQIPKPLVDIQTHQAYVLEPKVVKFMSQHAAKPAMIHTHATKKLHNEPKSVATVTSGH